MESINIESVLLDPSYIFSGPAKSHEFNTIISSIQNDIINLFNTNNENASVISNMVDIYAFENQGLKEKIDELNAKYQTLLDNIEMILNYDGIRILHSQLKNIIPINATVENGIVTLPTASISNKLVYNGIIPSQLEVHIYYATNPEGTEYTEITPNTDFLLGKYWGETLYINESSGIDTLRYKITIKVPTNTNNNLYANVLKLIPYPRYQIKIDSIEYKDKGGIVYNLDYNGDITIFNDAEISELTVTCSQSNYITSDGMRAFRYGLKELGLYYYDFLNSGSFVVPFDISNTSAYFKSVKEPLEPGDYELYIDNTLRLNREFDSDIYDNVQTVYILVNLTKGSTIPVYKQLRLPFYPRQIV